jgi:predicted RNA-binding protein YlxR (DUF448 family)
MKPEKDEETGPLRTCIVTRDAKPKEELIRFVVSPDGVIVPDLSGKLPGRGLYVSCSRLLVAEAIAKRLFSKAAKEQVTVPDGLLDNIQSQLEKRAGDALSLARKAGQAITGFEKVDEAVKTGEAAALLHADDASEDQVRKLRDAEIPTFRELPRALLSQVLGRENAVHVAVIHGSASEFFIQSARRFALFLA